MLCIERRRRRGAAAAAVASLACVWAFAFILSAHQRVEEVVDDERERERKRENELFNLFLFGELFLKKTKK